MGVVSPLGLSRFNRGPRRRPFARCAPCESRRRRQHVDARHGSEGRGRIDRQERGHGWRSAEGRGHGSGGFARRWRGGCCSVGFAAGGAVGYGANKLSAALRDDGQDISDLIVSKLLDRTQENQLSSGGTRNADGTLVAAIRDQTRKLESIDAGLRAQNTKPQAGGSREPR
jgi:hypothetical protein